MLLCPFAAKQAALHLFESSWPRSARLKFTRYMEATTMAISKELLDILACPKCKGDIHLNPTKDGLNCDTCRLIYPIKDDIPIMLIDEALPL